MGLYNLIESDVSAIVFKGACTLLSDATTNPLAALPVQLRAKADAVATQLRAAAGDDARVGVAYSGGVDSATLAALTAHAIGASRTVLLLAVSPSLARRERRFAHAQAEQLGLELVEVATRELDNPRYASNPVNRCYYCKDALFQRIEADEMDRLKIAVVAYGENADDARRPDRPGGKAAREHAVLYPLATAGASKQDVRALARAFGLASAEKPASPCLASRIPHGEPVTAQKLEQIDAAEDAVLAAGFSDCRVRHHGDLARIEVPADELDRFTDAGLRATLVAAIRAVGFRHVTFDLEGIRSGAFTLQLLGMPQ